MTDKKFTSANEQLEYDKTIGLETFLKAYPSANKDAFVDQLIDSAYTLKFQNAFAKNKVTTKELNTYISLLKIWKAEKVIVPTAKRKIEAKQSKVPAIQLYTLFFLLQKRGIVSLDDKKRYSEIFNELTGYSGEGFRKELSKKEIAEFEGISKKSILGIKEELLNMVKAIDEIKL